MSPSTSSRATRSRWPAPAFSAVAAAALAIAGCGQGGVPDVASARPGVVVSVPPQAWFVRQLAGPEVDVTVLVPPGASPALYEPTLQQMRALDRAEVLLTVGHPRFPFERAWGTELLRGRAHLRVVRAAEGCATVPEDPHVWLSPDCAASMTRRLADALVEERPERSDVIRSREEDLLGTIAELDRELSRALAPFRGRSFLVFHPALGYFARSYGLEQVAIEHRSGEPNPFELSSVLRRARERGIHTVLVQPQFSHEAAELVARELPGGRLVTVNPLGPDWPRLMRDVADALVASFGRGEDR